MVEIPECLLPQLLALSLTIFHVLTEHKLGSLTIVFLNTQNFILKTLSLYFPIMGPFFLYSNGMIAYIPGPISLHKHHPYPIPNLNSWSVPMRA
jgi:hypothetical protein